MHRCTPFIYIGEKIVSFRFGSRHGNQKWHFARKIRSHNRLDGSARDWYGCMGIDRCQFVMNACTTGRHNATEWISIYEFYVIRIDAISIHRERKRKFPSPQRAIAIGKAANECVWCAFMHTIACAVYSFLYSFCGGRRIHDYEIMWDKKAIWIHGWLQIYFLQLSAHLVIEACAAHSRREQSMLTHRSVEQRLLSPDCCRLCVRNAVAS